MNINYYQPYAKLISAAMLLFLFIYPATETKFKAAISGDGQFETDSNLQAQADDLLGLFDNMTPVPVSLSGETILAKGDSIRRGVAYTKCENENQPQIFVKKEFYEKTNDRQLTNILKHELTHAWLCRQGLMSGHDENFRRKFTAVGGFGN